MVTSASNTFRLAVNDGRVLPHARKTRYRRNFSIHPVLPWAIILKLQQFQYPLGFSHEAYCYQDSVDLKSHGTRNTNSLNSKASSHGSDARNNEKYDLRSPPLEFRGMAKHKVEELALS